jgi:putative hydrolase
MVNAIKAGRIHVITHPGNPIFPIVPEVVANAAAEYNVALEVNNSSFVHSRKGSEQTCNEIIKFARKYDAPMSIGSDAHIAYDVGIFNKSIEMLKANNYPAERIINRTVESLFDYLETKEKYLRNDFAEILTCK